MQCKGREDISNSKKILVPAGWMNINMSAREGRSGIYIIITKSNGRS